MRTAQSNEQPLRARRPAASRLLAALGGIAIGAAVLAGCGSSNTATTTTSTTAATTTTAVSKTSIEAAISTNWKAFFNGATSATRKIALLQNGSEFSTIITGQASSGLAQSVRATVSKVSILTPTTATVRYTISLGGQTALANQNGEAVEQNGTWKVSVASFCVLLGLEGTKSAACPTS